MAEKTLGDGVVVRKGDLKWLDELYNILIDAGIPCTVTSETACKGHCGDDWLLVVSKADQARAKERIEQYFIELHPELRVSNELANEGKCPACGFPVAAGANVCPDCGLTFEVIDEEKDEE